MSDSDQAERAREQLIGLYQELVGAWNAHDAKGMCALFDEGGVIIGFDGTVHDGRTGIEADLAKIFADHRPPAFVSKVREVRCPHPQLAILRAVVGLVHPDGNDIVPEGNAVQTLVATADAGRWRIQQFQTTPAAYHQSPDMSEELSRELREMLTAG